MSVLITKWKITQLCGFNAFDSGEAYHEAGKVSFDKYDSDRRHYNAIVRETSEYEVTIDVGSDGEVGAACTCSPLHDRRMYYCKHVAAVLIAIQAREQAEESGQRTYPSLLYPVDRTSGEYEHLQSQLHLSPRRPMNHTTSHTQLTDQILGLFHDQTARPASLHTRFDTRTPLQVEFICRPVSYGYRKFMFGIEMRIGPKRVYVVQKIRELLEQIHRREMYPFTKNFTYLPAEHSFIQENDAVIQALIQIHLNEKMHRETLANYYAQQASSVGGDRMLLIPPSAWETLLPLLVQAPTLKLEQESRTYEGIQLSGDLIPLKFEFDESSSASYQLDIEGLESITIMELYGAVLHEGKLITITPEHCKRLAELKQMLDNSDRSQIQIRPDQIEPFMDQVVPHLMKIGHVQIAQTITDRMIQTPLKARLYLDRVRDRLLAGLEFQYGEIVINPLEEKADRRDNGQILLRDGEKERRILELMEQGSFAKTESGYFMDDEDAEYEFLYHVLPDLEKLVQVYATTAVKLKLFTSLTPPKITVEVDERTNWLDFAFTMDGIGESEIRKLLKSLEEKRRYHRLSNGALMPLEGDEFQEIIRFMNEMGIRKDEINGSEFRVPIVRGLHLIDADRHSQTIKLGKAFRKLLDNIRNPDRLDFPVPSTLATILRDYQKEGYQWLKTLAHYRFGGILADDMGLGKTVQSIALLVSVLPEIREQGLPALIICPASLTYNWLNELRKFAPEIRAQIADGSKSERSGLLKDASSSQVDVLITSYPLIRRDIELYVEHSFHTLILDEAQYFKNHTTQTAQSVKAITAQHRIALTGTPVENSLEELWSIVNVVFPKLFPGRQAFNDLPREAVARRIRPFLLRRLKTDVLKELPDKIEMLQASELLPEQKRLYAAYLAKLRQETLKHLDQETFNKNRIKILAGLTRLRQICCHPALFVEDYEGSSAKFEQLMEIIEECRGSGKRMLIFSQFTQMLGLISRELGDHGIAHFYLDGQTPVAERVELCNRYNEGERDLFLVSLKAGGTGLNLTGADTVILYDLWWNPAVEQQATDRAHRIGQKKVVQVIRLVAQGTVEDKMYELQQRKKHLIEEIIQPGQETLSTLTEQDVRDILML
ncbi:helicase SNF [Paenibacillus albiflavus]|uniref:Helicase SNF n=1 Tax=Paenibacillus albiflavus TaxID=2545760 RepID=A0A4R4EJ87_9BACL|nr:DEAD/DEAH box helicase [Paenibacillus albiflavus]TCZ78295.1 helicase SNF [Paenibacillus albiflavus]